MSDVPQWKKDLIARLRNQNKRTAQQLFPQRTLAPSAVQQPVESGRVQCECAKMVQERWEPVGSKNDSDEDLHYGPGIVSKLKERYLSLAQREKPRPSILRKATSLENLLDDAPEPQDRLFQPSNKKKPNRYVQRGPELKRARSVETISSGEPKEGKEQKRESLHEEMLITNRGSLIISEKPLENENNQYTRINRPKRIAPVMNEKEKPPADVVKQTKMIFERKETRTRPQSTGEVATKVATYTSIIGQNKPAKKPAIKAKPVILNDKPKTNGVKMKPKTVEKEAKVPSERFSAEFIRPISPEKKFITDVPRPKSLEKTNSLDSPLSPKLFEKTNAPEFKLSSDVCSPKSPEKQPSSLPSPIPDISRIEKVEENGVNVTSLTETPDLIVTSSPIPAVNSPSFKKSATEIFLKEEIRSAQNQCIPSKPASPKKPSPAVPAASNSMQFIFTNNSAEIPNHLPQNKNVLNTQTPPSQPLKLEINGVNEPKKQTNNAKATKPVLTTLEIEKNSINAAKTLQQPKSEVIANNVSGDKVPKVKKQPPKIDNTHGTTTKFDFRDRKDVPDYVKSDGVNRVGRLEKPKVGEGGIILLPGASVGESFTDEDDEILRSLEAPPSPCDVTFINDNILIDGKSSLSQKTKKAKLKISFVDEGPEIYEYPSESSLLIEDQPMSPPVAQMRHSVPSITGSSTLANYTPKSTEDFQPGVTRSVQNTQITKQEIPETTDIILQEVERPFSAGTNTDILF